ncbi:MAG: Asp-tRNA(Asn)/Glu-tRNA(Gln) amidotransferase subunit GatC [Ignavibacteriae bacterium]|nr:Asp-tRNA(Asn)/Glu-tRNA(Gln) amidotransferase subunit GatC [Ignavibacteriota bacterium]NOG96895.1 Asp-tRNA(Asn)/Glu-tRNA(Gln) amidotransferase subunit GatC [Ignavibacteriota bacterium]
MAVTKDEVKYIASLSKLEFDESELEDFTKEFNQILNYIDKLNELDTENVEPLSHPVEKSNVFREDENIKSVGRPEALKNAPDSSDEYFKVPKVIKSK